jgi:hypothetical protein
MTFVPETSRSKVMLALAALMALAACGGSDETAADDVAQRSGGSTAVDLSKARPPAPPPPPPAPAPAPPPSGPVDSTVVGALALASSNAAGQAAGGSSCGISADGNLIAFDSTSSLLVPGDANNANDVFVKNLRTGAVQRASSGSGANCRQLTPDGRLVLMTTVDGTLVVKHLATGATTTVTPAPGSIPDNTGFAGGSVSDDGTKVAFVTVPTQQYVGQYSWVNTVPARIMIRNLADGSIVTLPTDNGRTADGEVILGHLNARLSPDGSRIAFVSSSAALVGGDTNGQPDVFVRNLATGATVLASSDSAGTPAATTVCCNQSYYKVEWVTNAVVQFAPDQPSSLGPRGEYLKNVVTGATSLLLASSDGANAIVSADLTKVVFGRLYGSGFDYRAFVRDLASGQEQIVSSSSAGVAGNGNANLFHGGISRDGARVVFHSNATNLFAPAPPGGSYQVYVKTIAVP